MDHAKTRTLLILFLALSVVSCGNGTSSSNLRSTDQGSIANEQPSENFEIRRGIDFAAGSYGIGALYVGDQFFCTGNLISASVVLTAAHCVLVGVSPQNLQGQLLEDMTFRRDGWPDAEVLEVRYHPNYAPIELLAAVGIEGESVALGGGDLALLKLDQSYAKFAKNRLESQVEELDMEKRAAVMGYGKDENGVSSSPHLGYLEMENFETAWEFQANGQFFSLDFAPDAKIRFSHGFSGQIGCQGDSGAAVWQNNKFTGVLSTLGARIANDCDSTTVNFFTSIPHYYDWIRSNAVELEGSEAKALDMQIEQKVRFKQCEKLTLEVLDGSGEPSTDGVNLVMREWPRASVIFYKDSACTRRIFSHAAVRQGYAEKDLYYIPQRLGRVRIEFARVGSQDVPSEQAMTVRRSVYVAP